MFQVRAHGLGGQGVVTLVTWAAEAAYRVGKHVQAFPFFSAERRGAPVKAYLRMDDKPISLRSQIKKPDILLVISSSVVGLALDEGMGENTKILINADLELAQKLAEHLVRDVCYLDATTIALENGLEVDGMPMVNVPLLGALVSFAKIAPFEVVMDVLDMPARGGNYRSFKNAAKAGYFSVRCTGTEEIAVSEG